MYQYQQNMKLVIIGYINMNNINYNNNNMNKSRKKDPVNNPSHYTNGNIQCIDAMVAAFGVEQALHFCKLNAFKYIWRSDLKNGIEDIEKAQWYINKYIKLNKKIKKNKK